jgi:hypothetical protein
MMANLVALIFVIMVLVLGIGACWAITANGAATTAPTDTFGHRASNETIQQNNASTSVAVETMPVLFIGFFVLICVVLVAAFAWLWKTGKSKASKY